MLFQDWSVSTPEVMIGSDVVKCVDHFTYFGDLISDSLLYDGILARILKGWLTLPACVICGVGEVSIFQPNDEFTVHQFAPFHFMGVKHNH